MELCKIVKSRYDNTIKYIMKTDDKLIIEFSYIDKNDGKDIICVPSQTMCNIGCKFCHTTDYIGKIKCRNLDSEEIEFGVQYIYKDLNLIKYNKVLLVSYMGCGEPIYNAENVVASMIHMRDNFQDKVPLIRFAVSTSIPDYGWHRFFLFTSHLLPNAELPVKLHFSLHYTIDAIRKEWMPGALNIEPSIAAIDFFKKKTGNPVEIHYALIDGINDTEQDAILLANYLRGKDMNVKFLFYNEKPTINVHASNKQKLNIFRKYLDKYNIAHEYYIPPGLDIGASCGQFLMDYYIQDGLND
jgi:23S rRNA (adenine2503-C2)-methyltransferase